MLALERLFRDDLQDGSLEQLMLLHPLPAVVLAKVMAHWMVTGLPLLILSPLVAMLLGMDVYGWQVMALTLLLGTPTLGFLGAPGVALTVGLKRGGVLLSILVLPLTIPLLIFATAAMDAASMHLPVDGYLAILGALLAGTSDIKSFCNSGSVTNQHSITLDSDFCSSLVSKLCGKHCINWQSHHGCIKSVAGLYRGWQLPVWSCLPSAGSGDSALLRLIIGGDRLPHYLPACACGDLVDGHLCINGGGGFYWPCLADENGQPGGGGDGPHWLPCLPLLPWLPALHGENRCGAPGGYGMHV